MSRIGKQLLDLTNVKLENVGQDIKVIGNKGELIVKIHPTVEIEINDNTAKVKLKIDDENNRKFLGLTRTLIDNAIKGVTEGFTKELHLVGVGYRASISGKNITLNLGYSHPVNYELDVLVDGVINDNTKIVLSSIDKQKLGQVASEIRSFRPPEPYKGKGVKYSDEVIKRKAGKAASK